jgi:hypothetical protein
MISGADNFAIKKQRRGDAQGPRHTQNFNTQYCDKKDKTIYL